MRTREIRKNNGWLITLITLIGLLFISIACLQVEGFYTDPQPTAEPTEVLEQTDGEELMAQPTPTLEPSPSPTATATAEPEVENSDEAANADSYDSEESEAEFVETEGWEVTLYDGATDQVRGWVQELPGLSPELWDEFPNVDNPRADFVAANGLEYGEDETSYGEQHELLDVVVPARHYRLVTGDYDLGFHSCSGGDETGCAIAIFNVGNVTASFEDVSVDAGFTVWGRYWNGDELEQAVWGLLSHATSNMMNLESGLNPSGITNAGANCSTPEGCMGVRATFVIISGNEVLVKGTSLVER